ncbi:MAG: DUF4178 domain-containing protein [Phycisphaerales bacterium]|nr:DUF4178 domain-containing protein [Phycisphaerales bacterium]MCB9856472.1 DUF4178 domain-containing protein [Phycisphaerales bacterium]MCB9863953.1 DUF4178 domain-containing protein [Phycisphaerales bacterium]
MFCPSCGAEIEADRRFAKLVVCRYCESAVLLDEKAARAAGKMAVLAQTPSPLFVGGTGTLMERRFRILGRVRYGYERGYWDEWYLAFDDGSSLWVGEDENNFTLESCDESERAPIEYADAFPGQSVKLGETTFHLDEKGVAICEGGEGQLPFPIISGERVPYLDLSLSDRFATIEYDIEDTTARVFRGRRLDLSEIRMDMTADAAGVTGGLKVERAADGERRERIVATGDRAKSVNCVCCGAPMNVPAQAGNSITCEYCGTDVDLTVRRVPCGGCDAMVAIHGREARSVVCPQCHRVIDVSRSEPTTLELAAQIGKPAVPFKMGQKCNLRGVAYVVVGHIRFVEFDEDGTYRSDEFLLFSKEAGYQWIVMENGHFSLSRELNDRPIGFEPRMAVAKKSLRFVDRTWKVFESGSMQVEWVDGELPWVAKIGDLSYYMDAISPPYLLSAEWTESEMEWYEAEYLERAEVAEAFGISMNDLPTAFGVAPHQPFKRSQFSRQSMGVMGLFAIVFTMATFWSLGKSGEKVGHMVIGPDKFRTEYVTDDHFTIREKDALCEAEFYADVSNSWEYFDVAVINSDDEVVLDFSAELSYYSGRDSEGSWTEGSKTDNVPFKLEKPGDYRFLILGQAGTGETPMAGYGIPVSITIREGIVLTRYYLFFALFCIAWLAIEVFRKLSFEGRRWAESDAADDDD